MNTPLFCLVDHQATEKYDIAHVNIYSLNITSLHFSVFLQFPQINNQF